MNGEFWGKTAIITGGASGMGLLTGKRMFESGANVVLADCDGEALEKVGSEFTGGGRLLTAKCDVRNFNEVAAVVKSTVDAYGTLDITVNCAGGNSCRIFNRGEEFCDLPIEQV